jgi:hypothetical protein
MKCCCFHCFCLSFQGRLAVPDAGRVDADLLQLAVNCMRPTTAAAAVRYLQVQLEPARARTLLLTAATRQHEEAVKRLLDATTVQQHVDAPTLAAMLSGMLCKDGTVQLLCRLPAAMQLKDTAVASLLVEATMRGANVAVEQLCKLASAQQMSSKVVVSVFDGCVAACRHSSPQSQNTHVMEHIVDLPAARHLGSSVVVQLLLKAIGLDVSNTYTRDLCVRRLCQLPAADDISNDEMVQLLLAVFNRQQLPNDILLCLFALSAVERLSCAEVQQLMCAAVQCGMLLGMTRLCYLSAAQQLSSEELLQPLQLAVALSRADCTEELCRLPAAQQLSSDDVVQPAPAGGSCSWPPVSGVLGGCGGCQQQHILAAIRRSS